MSAIAADPEHALTPEEVRALPAMLTVAQTARAVNINPYTAYRLIAAEEFPVEIVRVGRAIRARKSDVMTFLGLNDDGAGDPAPAPSDENIPARTNSN